MQPAPRVRWRGWPPWAWLVLVLGASVGALLVAFFSLLIGVSRSVACDQASDPGEV